MYVIILSFFVLFCVFCRKSRGVTTLEVTSVLWETPGEDHGDGGLRIGVEGGGVGA